MLEKESLNRVIVILVMLLFVVLRFGSYLKHPGQVIEPYGDGFKAYTVIDYHAEYDSSYTHFGGMNYPYGDHAIPSATQPLISNSIKFISENLGDITDYTIAIVNLSMLLSIILCGFFLYLIFRALDLPAWYALLLGIGITFLSPQIPRMHAHYGLSHPEVLPATLFFLLRFTQKPLLKYSIALGGIVILYSLIHFYYFAILAFTISFYFLFHFLSDFQWKRLPGLAAHYTVQMLLPLGFFIYWLFMQDPIEDRTPEPWGFFEFHALWDGIVMALEQPFWQWVDEHVIKIRRIFLENKAYVGLIAILGSVAIGIHWLIRKLANPLMFFEHEHSRFLHSILWASLVILFLALGLPFTYANLDFLLDYAGPIRQFRSMGRFAWLFYFVINIIVFTWIYEQLKGRKLAYGLLPFVLLVLWGEAYFNSYARDLKMDTVQEMQAGQSFAELPGINYENFQAIVTVPYYNIGSDQFWWEPEGFILQKSLTMSIQTGLPVTSAMLTRSSRSQTYKQFQLMTEPYRTPLLLADLPDQRPFLMMLDQREYEKEIERYEHVLEGADLLYAEGDRLRLYRLPLGSFAERLDDQFRKLERSIYLDSTINWSGSFGVRGEIPRFYYDDLTASESELTYFGKGAFAGRCEDKNTFSIATLPEQKAEEDYLISLWMYIGDDRRTRSYFQLDEYDSEGNHIRQHRQDCHRLIDLFDVNGWAMIEMPFKPAANDSRFELIVSNPRLRGERLFLDEFLIRPKDQDVFGKFNGYIWKNNRHFVR